MGFKRDHDQDLASNGGDVHGQSSKRRRRDQANGADRQYEPAVDATYGQRSVFPSFGQSTVPSDDDLDCEDEQEALAYLQSVRHEASGIPHLLVAPKAGPQLPSPRPSSDPCYDDDNDDDDDDSALFRRDVYSKPAEDSRGYYQDGAYTAAPDEEADGDGLGNGESEDDAACRAFYASLAERFAFLQQQLQQDPPDELVAALPKSQNPTVGTKSSTARVWTFRLDNTDPWPVQIAAMDKDVVFMVLRLLMQGKFLRHGQELTERTSRWIWSLLARLPDRGELDYIEIGCIRDLGKRAVLMMTSLASIELLREQVDLDECDEEDAEGAAEADDGSQPMDEGSPSEEAPEVRAEEIESTAVEGKDTAATDDAESIEEGEISDEPAPQGKQTDMETIRRRLLASLEEAGTTAAESHTEQAEDETEPDKARAEMNLRATLNMILTVAGEFYGQRDLLAFRSPFSFSQ